ncbi:MAG: hypothetical protein ACO1NY_08325, partial [Pseudorhodoplanes sp.]
QPQTGKSRFVLNADMTPADLGAVAEAARPVAAVSRVPACGEGCKLEQPAKQRDNAYGSRSEAGSSGSRSGSSGPRVIVVNNVNGNQTQQAAKPAATPRSSVRMRRR